MGEKAFNAMAFNVMAFNDQNEHLSLYHEYPMSKYIVAIKYLPNIKR